MGKTVAAVVGVVAAVAIAVVAPYLAPLVLGALGITATATAIAIATAVISIGLSLAVSLAFRALGVGAPSAKNQVGPPQVFRQAISNSFIVYGKRRVGGLLVFFHGKQDSDGNHWRNFVIAVAGHECEGVVDFWLNDEIVTTNSDGLVTSGPYANAAWLWFRDGASDQLAQSEFVANCDGKWTINHRGRGVAAIFARFVLTDDVVQAGMPNITVTIEGKQDILDTRTSTTGYTRNAALVFYDWLQISREQGGYGAYADEIPSGADWINAQANVCDETVNSEPRYAIDAVIQTGAAPSEIRDVLVVNQAGSNTYSGGKHLMRPGYWNPSSATLSEDDLTGAIQVSPFLPPDAAANEVQGTYISPDANYQAAPLTTWTTDPAPDDIKQLDVDLAFVTNKDQGDRILAIMGKRAQCEKTLVWPMNIMGLAQRAMDTVQVSKSDYGLDNYAWQITNWGLSADFGVVLNLREENADIYDDGSPVAPTTPPTVSVPSPILTQRQIIELISSSSVTGLTYSVADTGAVTISNHSRVYNDKPPVSVTGTGGTPHAVSGAAAGDLVYIFYDDPARAGGAVTYQHLRLAGGVGDDSAAYASPTYPYRHLVIVATVPPAAGTTSGGSDVGSGGGVVRPPYKY